MSGYQIADEPTPGHLARFAVNPIFPLLAAMLLGVFVAWPWFAFNALAVGSPTRRRELSGLGLGLVLISVLVAGLLSLVQSETLRGRSIAYAALVLPVAKLAIVYWVYVLQSRTIEIYEYYGGKLQNGMIVLIILFFLRPRQLLEGLPEFFLLLLS